MDEGTLKTPIQNVVFTGVLLFGWCSHFVGSESGQTQSVKLQQIMHCIKAKPYSAKKSVTIHSGLDSIVMHGFTFRMCFLQTSELIMYTSLLHGTWPAKRIYGGKIQPSEVLPPIG
jgi:hypothetical protein